MNQNGEEGTWVQGPNPLPTSYVFFSTFNLSEPHVAHRKKLELYLNYSVSFVNYKTSYNLNAFVF